jgi:acetylornithine/N-succinyldiaminopimelate aminotransferase
MNENVLMNTYGKLPIAFESGDGCWLFDTDGNRYFDTFSGVAVSTLGHSNPRVTKAIKDQAGRLLHLTNVYHNPLQLKLAQELCRLSDMDKAFFCNSGAEANETALKIARKDGHERGIAEPKILVMSGGFHGRTMGTLSASSNPKVKEGFTPLLDGFAEASFNDIEDCRRVLDSLPDFVAILIEPVQGESGVNIATNEFLQGLRTECDERNLLLICDEVQSGNGRCGAYFAYQTSGIIPDIVTTAKGLANGFPIGACLAKGRAANTLTPGSHGSTFGGNPTACAAANAVISELTNKGLIERSRVLGEHIVTELEDALSSADYIKDIRGKGLMIGIEMSDPCFALVPLAKAKGILLNVTSDNVIRLLPPLNITDEECEFLIDALIQIIRLYAADDRAKPRS